jgi:hypothetical protein
MAFVKGGMSNRAAAAPPPPVNDSSSHWQFNVTSPVLEAYRPTAGMNQPSGGDEHEPTFARGGHGIFGDPMVSLFLCKAYSVILLPPCSG